MVTSCSEPTLWPVGKLLAIDVAALHNPEGFKDLEKVVFTKCPVGVEIDSGFVVNRDGQIQASSWLDNPLELLNRQFRSLGRKGIAIAAQADMLDHAQTGERRDRTTLKRQGQDRALLEGQGVQRKRQRP